MIHHPLRDRHPLPQRQFGVFRDTLQEPGYRRIHPLVPLHRIPAPGPRRGLRARRFGCHRRRHKRTRLCAGPAIEHGEFSGSAAPGRTFKNPRLWDGEGTGCATGDPAGRKTASAFFALEERGSGHCQNPPSLPCPLGTEVAAGSAFNFVRGRENDRPRMIQAIRRSPPPRGRTDGGPARSAAALPGT